MDLVIYRGRVMGRGMGRVRRWGKESLPWSVGGLTLGVVLLTTSGREDLVGWQSPGVCLVVGASCDDLD